MTYEQLLEMEDRIGKENIGLNSKAIAKLKIQKFKELKIPQDE